MSRTTWQLQEAKNKLSEVVDAAVGSGPQVITRRGKEVAVVISTDLYRRLSTPGILLSEFFRTSPLAGAGVEIARDRSDLRAVEL